MDNLNIDYECDDDIIFDYGEDYIEFVKYKDGGMLISIDAEEKGIFNFHFTRDQLEYLMSWISDNNNKLSSENITYECKVCGECFENSDELYEHYDLNHNR
jgi:hypothetical protein